MVLRLRWNSQCHHNSCPSCGRLQVLVRISGRAEPPVVPKMLSQSDHKKNSKAVSHRPRFCTPDIERKPPCHSGLRLLPLRIPPAVGRALPSVGDCLVQSPNKLIVASEMMNGFVIPFFVSQHSRPSGAHPVAPIYTQGNLKRPAVGLGTQDIANPGPESCVTATFTKRLTACQAVKQPHTIA
jgi:hypothetical protein